MTDNHRAQDPVWNELKQMAERLRPDDPGAMRQILLTGAHGVGKTHYAVELAKLLTGNDNSDDCSAQDKGSWSLVSFHPAYTYEDFVRGISVRAGVRSRIVYRTEERRLMEMIRRAKSNSHWHVLILDDIGRADLSGVLGELLYALEYRGRGVTLRDGTQLSIPNNLIFIATYNNAIRYEKPLDYALLRRFHIIPIPNEPERAFSGADEEAGKILHEVRRIIDDHILPHRAHEKSLYMPGRGYFSQEPLVARLKKRYMIAPLLRQYVKDDILDPSALAKLDSLESTMYTTDYDAIAHLDLPIEKVTQGEDSVEHQETKLRSLAGKLQKSRHIDSLRASPRASFESAKNITSSRRGRPFNGSTWISALLLLDHLLDSKLISHAALAANILFNPAIVWTINENNTRQGHLLVPSGDADSFHQSQNKNNPRLYTRGSAYRIRSQHYALFRRITEDKVPDQDPSPAEEAKAPAIPIAQILHRIIYYYYETYISALDEYIRHLNVLRRERQHGRPAQEPEHMSAAQLNQLKSYAIKELDKFHRNSKGQDFEGLLRHAEALKILWAKRDSEIEDEAGNKIRVVGVYKVEKEDYVEIMDTIGVKQAILYGPPGTSKTYTAKKIVAKAMIAHPSASEEVKAKLNGPDWEEALERYKLPANPSAKTLDPEAPVYWDLVQFHPSYSYEDFVRGITVDTSKDGSPIYRPVNMALGRMAHLACKEREQALKDQREPKSFFLIIDEINRANMANVFGELIYALEYRGKAVRTPYKAESEASAETGEEAAAGSGDTLTIPDNLYLIGTMNTADKSIGGMDYAIRRRFLFFPLLPDPTVVKRQQGNDSLGVKLFEVISGLFDHTAYLAPDYDPHDVMLGHSYFLVREGSEPKTQLKLKFRFQVLPILYEYYKDGILQFEAQATSGFVQKHKDIYNRLTELIRHPEWHHDDGKIGEWLQWVEENAGSEGQESEHA